MSIIILTGKSASGKDSLLNYFVEHYGYKTLMSSTDRPMRNGETNGKEYNFRTKEEFDKKIKNNDFIEYRAYTTTVNGKEDIWRYGSEKPIDLNKKSKYIMVLDLSGAKEVLKTYPKHDISVFYMDCPDNIRKTRCIDRGDFNETEWKRRQISDNKDFSPLKIAEIKAKKVPAMLSTKECASYIKRQIRKKEKELEI